MVKPGTSRTGQANPEEFVPNYSEGAQEVIESFLTDGHLLWEALNIPNQGQITNLPLDAIIELPAQSLLMASQEPKSVNCQKESLNSCAGRLLLAISLWTLSCMVIGSWLYRHCCSILSFVIWISHRRYWTSTLSPTGNNCQHSGNKMRSPLIRWGF